MFPVGLYLFALVGGAVISAASLPLWRRWCKHVGLVDAPGYRKIHDHPVPLAGGLAVITGLVAPILGATAWAWLGPLPESFDRIIAYGLAKRGWQITAILGGAVAMLALGVIDDRRDLAAKWKFAAQVLIAVTVAASGIRVTMFVESPAFSYAVTVLWILTVTNAVNFQDNMNGLCAGLGLIAGWFFAWHSGLEGQYLVASLAFLFTGALAGFLPYNFPRGSVFLGDGGSHVVGFLLAVLAILHDFYSSRQPSQVACACAVACARRAAGRSGLGDPYPPPAWPSGVDRRQQPLLPPPRTRRSSQATCGSDPAAHRDHNRRGNIFEVNQRGHLAKQVVTQRRKLRRVAGRQSRARVAQAVQHPACHRSRRSDSETCNPAPA